MDGSEEGALPKGRPWPLTALAAVLALGGLFYLYDLIVLGASRSLSGVAAAGFVCGTAVCFALARGIWRLEAWSRIVMVWLSLLVVGGIIFAIPFLFLLRPPGTVLNAPAMIPLLLPVAVAVAALRYLGSPEARRAFGVGES